MRAIEAAAKVFHMQRFDRALLAEAVVDGRDMDPTGISSGCEQKEGEAVRAADTARPMRGGGSASLS
jgi:hypothetical protein